MKTNLWVFLLLCIVFPIDLTAQVVKGKVVDSSGEPVPNASIYIREISQGIMVDDKGDFQTTLQDGNYIFEFSSLGYERKIVPVTVGKQTNDLRIEMERKTYALREVQVYANREDPAYAIMRKAIAMAPFYLHQVKSYESEIYLKGTIKAEKIPRYMNIQTGGNQKLKDLENKLFLIESQNEVIFTAPNKYEQHVVAATSNIPMDLDIANALDVVTTNIYDPNAMGRISPLSTHAFSYYNFSWEGVTTEGEHLVNKIRVLPKKKNPKLVTGWLYIIENSWNVQRADLSSTEFGVTIRFTATYNEVKPYAFLPTAYDMDIKVDIMGVKASGKYYSSIQYKEVELNESQGVIRKKGDKVQPEIKSGQLTKKQEKARQKLEVLNAKENLSNRDAYKMAKLMEDAVEADEQKQERVSLELLPGNSNVKLTVDSLAVSRDSSYWAEIRNLPLRPEEIESYQMKDSLKFKDESGQGSITISAGSSGSGWIMGGRKSLGKKMYLGYNGLLGIVPEYNFVDGVWLGQRLTLGMNIDKTKQFSVSPSVYYVTARKTINWQIDGDFQYAPIRNGHLTVSGGNTSTDFSREGELRLLNSLSSLFFGSNPIKFYQKRFIDIINRIDIANGLILTTAFSVEDRNALENQISFSIFNGSPDLNIPGNMNFPMEDNRTTKYAVNLEYTPRYFYHMYGGKKRYAYSKYPTFTIGYLKGITRNEGNYDRLDGSIRQDITLNPFDRIRYSVEGGTFFNARKIAFPDYKHFRTNELFLTGNSLENSFSLLDNYRYSTNKSWLQAHLNYSSAYLLIKHLPFLQNYMFNESLHARTLWVSGRNYLEAGYSIGIPDMGGIGVFVGFEKGKYDAIGFTISFPILRGMGVK